MSQPSVARYFNTRKRAALNSVVDPSAKGVLVLDQNSADVEFKCPSANLKGHPDEPKIVVAKTMPKKSQRATKKAQKCVFTQAAKEINTEIKEIVEEHEPTTKETPANLQKSINAMDKVTLTGNDVNFSELKQKLTRSSRLKELKASLNRCKKLEEKAKEIQQAIKKSEATLNSKESRSAELEVRLSQEKLSESAKKDVIVPVPQKQVKDELPNSNFTLPYKYRYLMEIFRSVDIACQILHNRKETITFRKLKPAVEEMLRRNVQERHLGQIKTIFPDAFCFAQEKLKIFGGGVRQDRWELVVKPNINQDIMSSDVLLDRKRKCSELLLQEAHKQHDQFLEKLGLKVTKEKLRCWHPEFNLDNVPDIESDGLPKPPEEEKYSTGKEVLERARELFKCNPKMQKAFEMLHAKREEIKQVEKPVAKPNPLLKGIPKALLEKVRQKQAAKALENMTRSSAQEKEIQMYQRLPELARLTRSLFVSERKNVLPLDTMVDKLGNSFKTYMTRVDIEVHLKVLAKEAPEWLIFHEIRRATYVKIDKTKDVTTIVNTLERITQEKSATA